MNVTPAMQQYYDLKESYKDAILFFRMGDFYEMFDEDAQIAHNVLWIALTTRNKNAENPIPLAWIPFHAKEKYLSSLINAWYKVAIAEQVSDPKLKGIVEREVVRVVTPSTLQLESDHYDTDSTNSTLLSITYEKDMYGVAVLDISTNNFSCCEFDSLQKLWEMIYKVSPNEVVLEKSMFANLEIQELLEKRYGLNVFYFRSQSSPEKKIQDFFSVTDVWCFGVTWKHRAMSAVAQLLEYIEQHQKATLSFITQLSYDSFSQHMWLDESTIRSLDLVYNISTNSQKMWTLFWVLDKTKTSMGRRYLREQIIHPLQDIQEIERRQEYISCFVEDKQLLDKVSQQLKYVADIDAILNRISLNRAGIKDMIQLKKSLQSVLEVVRIIKESDNTVLQKIYL